MWECGFVGVWVFGSVGMWQDKINMILCTCRELNGILGLYLEVQKWVYDMYTPDTYT